jgi:hypothetical protein
LKKRRTLSCRNNGASNVQAEGRFTNSFPSLFS